MARNRSSSGSAHQQAVKSLVEARQNARKHVFELERQDTPPGQIFVNTNHPEHPHKSAHAAIVDYYNEVDHPENTVKVDKKWRETLSDAAGNDIEVTVPRNANVTQTVNEETVGNFIPSMDRIETKTETVKLDTFGHKWSGRSIIVQAKVDSPYRTDDMSEKDVRLWTPPVLIKAVYKQLNACLGKLGLLTNPDTPMANKPEIADPREQPWNDGEAYLREDLANE